MALASLIGAVWLLPLLLATLYNATPLILAAMGGVLSEKAGVVNIALEGLILAGAFTGICVQSLSGGTGIYSALIGLLAVVVVGGLLGMMHAFLTQKTRANHVVSGLGITLLAMGATRYFYQRVFHSEGIKAEGAPRLLFIVLALILPAAIYLLLKHTKFGLRLRAVGENPDSSLMAGIASFPVRFAAVTLSGILGALAGAYLSMGDAVHSFTPNMSAGKGFIALAAVIFGKWNPLGAAAGALFFGFFDALQSQLQISGIHLIWLGIEWTDPYILQSLPYLMTIAALVSVIGRATPPASLGKEIEPA